jgi:hypothetical protein
LRGGEWVGNEAESAGADGRSDNLPEMLASLLLIAKLLGHNDFGRFLRPGPEINIGSCLACSLNGPV